MQDIRDLSKWHTVSLRIPLPSADSAVLLKRVVEVDRPLRPSELIRELTVDGSTFIASFRAATVAQARVALDHFLSDLELVVQTMHRFGPTDTGPAPTMLKPDAPSLEVGLEGRWEGVRQ